MVVTPATSPSTSPTGAPEPELVFDNVATQTDRELAKLKEELDIDGAAPDVRHKEIEKVEAFFREKKDTITKITREEINNIKTAIHDENQEIEGQLQLTDTGSIELNNSADTPPEAPAEPVAPEVSLPELSIPEDIPAIPNDYVSNNKPSGLQTFIINFLQNAGLSFIANWLTMRTMGYKSEREMEYTKKSMSNILAIKESPVNSIIRLDDITEREFRSILANHNDIDLTIPENVEAAFLGKHGDNPKYRKYHRIYKGIEDMAEKIKNAGEGNYNPIERLDELLSYSKKSEFDPEYPGEEDTQVTHTPVVSEIEEERPETPQEKLDALDAAERADKKLEEAIRDNQAGHPDIELAQKEVDAIKNHSKDSLISALETTEDHLNKTKDLLKITQQEKEKAEVANDTAKMAQLEKEIGRMTTLITNLEGDHGIIARLKNIAKEMIENPDALRKDWKIKESLTAKNTVEQAQKAENEVEKMYSIMEGKEKEEQKKDEATEKVDEKMKKWNELYQEVKKSELGYIHKKEEGRIYIINNGNLFRYKYQGGIIDTAQNWLRSWFDRDLPVDIDTFETIQILDKNGTWADSGAQTNYWFHESWWLKKSTRISHNADAPENLNYYTS